MGLRTAAMFDSRIRVILISTLIVIGLPALARSNFELPPVPAMRSKEAAPSQESGKPLPAIKLDTTSGGKQSETTNFDQAAKVNLMPIAIMRSESEEGRRREFELDAEQKQLSELWAATIDRSADIQFVINVMQPKSDEKHGTATGMRYLSGALFNVMQSAPMMLPANGGGLPLRMGAGLGSGMIESVLGKKQQGKYDQSRISQQETIILYKMVRDTADRLVECYRSYKSARNQLEIVGDEVKDAQDVAVAAGGNADIDYNIRKAQREKKRCQESCNLYRQQLADLAGAAAVAKLDVEILAESDALERLETGAKRPLTVPPTRDACIPDGTGRLQP